MKRNSRLRFTIHDFRLKCDFCIARAKLGNRQSSIANRRFRHDLGVASVLAMMFLVIFGSLAAAMAVVAQSNLRTAESGRRLSRAMSAAETGIVFAKRRLEEEGARFVVEKGVMESYFAEDLWMGTVDQAADGTVTILQPTGYTTGPGIIHAVRDAHDNDDHNFNAEPSDASLPYIDLDFGSLRVKPIALTTETNPPYFRLTYELLSSVPFGDPHLRVTSEGVDGDIRRTLQMDFRIEKKIEFAILSPNRIMIGKNVLIEGPLGSRYGVIPGTNDPNENELNSDNGDPLVLRSDFYYLDPALDLTLDEYFGEVVTYDADGDARLRPDHPTETNGLSGHADWEDYDGDEYVDDYDLFLKFFDADNDGRVCYDSGLANGAGYGALTEELTIDFQLAQLIDEAVPDRDLDGEITFSDTQLGYLDGVLDALDLYAKVRGRLAFSVRSADWETYHGESYQTVVQGPVRHDLDVAPATFEASDDDMREITTDMFTDSRTWFEDEGSDPLWEKVGGFFDENTGQSGANLSGGSGSYTPPNPLDPDAWERVPFDAPAPYDHYNRPIFRNMKFDNLFIPMGTNALFEGCTFEGVTYIETQEGCDSNCHNWNYSGAVHEYPLDSGIYQAKFTILPGEHPVVNGNPVIPGSYSGANDDYTRPFSNNLRFHDCTFLGSIAGDKPFDYTHWRNKVQLTGDTRFYIDSEDPDLAVDPHPDAGDWKTTLETMDPDDVEELEKSSILTPGWSVDVGSFTDPHGPKIKLKGTIISGILDLRGTAELHGTLLMTFRPKAPADPLPDQTAGPLAYGGLPDAFNTTIGYFGPLDGDGEGEEPDPSVGFGRIYLRYNQNMKLPDGIPWPVRITADPTTYTE